MDFIQNWPLRQSTVPSLDCSLTMLCHKNYRINKKFSPDVYHLC